MRLHYAGPLPEPIGFLLLPRFSMMAFFSAVEPLRIANRIAGETLFTWRVISLDSAPVTASNDMTLLADDSLESAPALPSIAICASFEPEERLTRRLLRWLHQRDQDGCVLGGIDTGSLILARADLLTGHRVTLHWESLPAFRERFPELDAVESLFEVGPRRFSCAGGAAAMDMMLDLIARRHGEALAAAVSEQLIHARMRPRHDQQRQRVARDVDALPEAVGADQDRRRLVALALEQPRERLLPLHQEFDALGVARRSQLLREEAHEVPRCAQDQRATAVLQDVALAALCDLPAVAMRLSGRIGHRLFDEELDRAVVVERGAHAQGLGGVETDLLSEP